MAETPAFRILALGSPHGDDQVAWRIAERLRREPALTNFVFTLDSPFQLIEHFAADRATIIIDACQSGMIPGSIVRVRAEDLDSLRARHLSSHGGTVSDAIRMAEVLGRRPASLVILVMEMGSCGVGSEMSAACRSSLDPLEQAVRGEIARLRLELASQFAPGG